MLLTKSDFLLYLDDPIHLWAKTHNAGHEVTLSPFEAHLTKQGYQIEALAQTYLEKKFGSATSELLWQQTFVDVHFEARTDAMVHDRTEDVYDLIEIKSSTHTRDTKHLYDVTYQTLIIREHLPLRHVYILTVNPEYVREGEIDPSDFFILTKVDLTVNRLLPEVSEAREKAWGCMEAESSTGLEPCVDPKTCPCPELCHPNLPEHSIYDVSGLSRIHRKELRGGGILSMFDIPADYPIKPKQRTQIEVTRSGQPLIVPDLIRHELEKITAPIAFLDYETFNPGIPMYDGYRPYGVMVTQYSLHVLESLDAPLQHYEYLVTEPVDPGRAIVHRLEQDLPKTGTVIAWNKLYEMGCNRAMAELYPGYRDFLLDVNDRMYDLGDPFKDNTMYVLPEFNGSWSIKNVLPVLVPELSYKELTIGEGATAMNEWWRMVHEDVSVEEHERIKQDLLKYCELDTYAMVRIWEKLVETVKSN